MRNRNLNQNEEGRSMVEMLGVLAVVGLLSVIAVAAFRIALNKAKANAIIHDGRMVWAEALAWQTVPTRNDWIDSQAANESGKSFAVWRDIKDNNYIKVEGVEEEVCEQMLPHQHEGSLLFLTTSFEDLTACPEGENAIVMAFDGVSGKPAECENQKGCQDLYSDAFYCDGDGHCQECDATISVVNETGDGCRCNSNMALTCDDGNGNTWCCGQDEYGNERICGDEIGECTESDGTCEYTVNVPTEFTYTTNCSYRVSVPSEFRYTTNCSYNVSVNETTGAVTVSPREDNCPTGQYCYLAYTESDCSQEATEIESGILYGTCILETAADKSCGYDQNSQITVEPNQDNCPTGQYCYLAYTESDCSQEATEIESGILYGTCILETAADKSCAYGSASNVTVSESIGCPINKYCYLKWTDSSCSSVAETVETGTLYGACMGYTSTNPDSCPATN